MPQAGQKRTSGAGSGVRAGWPRVGFLLSFSLRCCPGDKSMLKASVERNSAPLLATAAPGSGAPRPTLKAHEVLALTVGIVIGAGIFRSPSLVADAAGSE